MLREERLLGQVAGGLDAPLFHPVALLLELAAGLVHAQVAVGGVGVGAQRAARLHEPALVRAALLPPQVLRVAHAPPPVQPPPLPKHRLLTRQNLRRPARRRRRLLLGLRRRQLAQPLRHRLPPRRP